MTPLSGLVKLLRPLNLLLGSIAVLVSAAVMDSISQTGAVIKAILTVVTLNGAANAFNDYRDLEIDRINHAHRPLPRGETSPGNALWSAIALFAIGIGISAFLNRPAFIIAALMATPLMVIYSLWLKGWVLIGNLTVAFILGLTFIFVGAAFGSPWAMLTPALLAFGFTLIRELVKDVADMEGDKLANLKTFPVRYGIEASVRLVVALIILLCVGALAPYWLDIYGIAYLVVLVLGIEIPLFFIVSLLVKSPSIRTCTISSQILKACIFAGLFAVYLG